MSGFPINPPGSPLGTIAGNSVRVSPEWYRFFSQVQKRIGSGTDPLGATPFLTLDYNDGLGSERKFTPVSGQLTGTDGGADGPYTLGLADTAVTPSGYGSASTVPSIVVDAKGRITSASDTPIAINASAVTGNDLTRVNDTNVTLTLGGTPTGSLLKAVSFTLGWTGTLDETRGGTGMSSYIAGDLIYAANATTLAQLGIGTTNYVLTSNGTLPTWTANTGTGNVVRASKPSFTTAIGVGAATASASGSGISFPATQDASTDPNTMDDYEEGTWTPTVTAGSGTLTTVSGSGYYTKIGRHVFTTVVINITDNGTGANHIRYTLPFTAAASARWVGVGRELNATGSSLTATLSPSEASAVVFTYNNTYPGGTGYQIVATLDYFV
ncbi:hypothetical protein [Novosphingobium sp. KN65.2]|uniref:hypothetical protein n=1 Tax=Novosphingobium sp. KN65.2 TaxID=1478134 RepID=UPI0005E5AF00|nr:hypothetical protein [Novosphingobium sp. KN65.2]CDO34429.1 hypothetical protein SPHV1_1570002 [Novosphingobium sp. KN65.2]